MLNIVILEDEETIGQIYTRKLEKAGFQVRWIKSAEQVESTLQEFPADAVMVDHGIKGHEVSGLDIIPNIRKMLPDSKIIMLSNYSQSDMKEAALRAGADEYMIKINTSPKQLVEHLQTLLSS